MKKIIFILLLFPTYLTAQTLFSEDFNNNNNLWATGQTDSYSLAIYGGEYYFGHFRKTAIWYTWKSINIDTYKNFEITTRLRKISGINNFGYGIVWGMADTQNFFAFELSANGAFHVGKMENGQWNETQKWQNSPAIKQGYNAVNNLKITKNNTTLLFYINNVEVSRTSFSPFFGNKIGFSINRNQKIAIDYLKVALLEDKKINSPPEIEITAPNISRGFHKISGKMMQITGRASDENGIFEVKANGIEADLRNGGYFTVSVPLAIGANTITIEAFDVNMNSSTKTFQVSRTPEAINDNFQTFEKRVALVFGNSNYSGAANLGLNPINDAKDMATTLQSIGFDVIIKTDADLTAMNNAIREFGRQNRDATVALFYFAGHGMQIERENFLLPVGVKIKDKNDVNFECVSVNTVQKIMETSNADRLNLIVLDACRNNPFRTWQRGGNSGLADMTPPSGTLIAFATSPGATAANGNQRNGLYTGELIKQLKKPQRIEDVFINTRIEVERKSGGQQSPWELARLRGKYFLVK